MLGYSDPAIDSCPALRGWKLCFRIQRNAWSSVVHALRQSRSLLKRFTHFLREGGRARPVRAWNVDIISRPLYLAVNCSVSLASEHRYADGPDNAELPGGAAVPGWDSDPFIDKIETD